MITENKLKHTIAVARQCEILAKGYGLSESEQNACFAMGFLHDIGYEHCLDTMYHPEEGYNILRDMLKHSDEVLEAIRNHGKKYEYLSVYDRILNVADLTIDHVGNSVTMEERLESIKERYGADSEQYKDALKQYNVLIGVKENEI